MKHVGASMIFCYGARLLLADSADVPIETNISGGCVEAIGEARLRAKWQAKALRTLGPIVGDCQPSGVKCLSCKELTA